MEQLTSLDAQFLALDSGHSHGHGGALAILDPSGTADGTLEVEQLRELIASRIHVLPPLRQRIVDVPLALDYPYRVEERNIDLEFHVQERALRRPTEQELGDRVAELVALPLDRARPLWQLFVIHNLPEGHVALLTKMHHALIDGVSGAELFGLLLDTEANPTVAEPPVAAPAPGEDPSRLEMLARGCFGLLKQPVRAARSAPTALPHLDAVPGIGRLPGVDIVQRLATEVLPNSDGEILGRPSTSAPWTRFNGPISAHRRFAFCSIPLARVRAVKDELGTTVNDVIVALCSNMLRVWLLEHEELPDEQLHAFVPLSVRSEDEREAFGNRISLMVVEIPTNEADPVRQVQLAADRLKSAKERYRALPAQLMQDVNHFIPPALFARAMRLLLGLTAGGRLQPAANVTISNIPGPQVPLYCAGAKVIGLYGMGTIIEAAGLFIVVFSYCGELCFGIASDRGHVDEPWRMTTLIERCLDELEQRLAHSRPAR